MKGTIIKDIKYKGYLIKPSLKGFKVFRKDYYIETYSTLQIAKNRIDKVADKRSESQKEVNTEECLPENNTQLTLF